MKPSPAATWPERTSLVSRFQAITALARAPPAEVAAIGDKTTAMAAIYGRDRTVWLRKPLLSETSRNASRTSIGKRDWKTISPLPEGDG